MAMYPYIIHNNPEVYENPHEFQFDRFLVEDNDDDDDHIAKAAAAATSGMERVESVDMLHIKQHELRQLRQSRRRDRDVRDSRHSVVTATAATSVDQALTQSSVDDPANTTSVDLREQTLKDLRASGRLFSRILRESQSRVAVGSGSSAEECSPDASSHSSPDKRVSASGITISQLLQRQGEEEKEKEKEKEKEEKEKEKEKEEEEEEKEREKEKEGAMTPVLPARGKKGSDSRRYNPASSPLQEQLNSSGEVDLASPHFLRRAQRLRKSYADDNNVDTQSDPDSKTNVGKTSPNSPLRRPSLVSIQVNLVDNNPEPAAAEEEKEKEREKEKEEKKAEGPSLRTSGPRSKHLLNLSALSKRDRSVSLGVIPQQLMVPDQATAPNIVVDNNLTDTSAGGPFVSTLPLSHNLPTSSEPAATSASLATAGLGSPRVSREQHLAFKKRERTGSFNIPGDHRQLMARRQEKKFYYKGRELRYHLMPFGGGAGMCPGRYFARNELKLFVAVMIYYFDLELLPNEQGEVKLPPLDETRLGIGILPPSRDLPFRFRLRDEHLADFQQS